MVENQIIEGEKLDLSSKRKQIDQHGKLVSWAKDAFNSIKNDRVSLERQWYLNLAFYFGKQYTTFRTNDNSISGYNFKLYTPPAPYYRSRPVINRIRKTIRTELSQLTNNKPNAFIIPASADDRDLIAANAGEQIWNSIYTDKKLKAVIRQAVWWTIITGVGFIKCYYDFSKGPGTVTEDNTPVLDLKGKQILQGDVCFMHETPFHIYVPDFKEYEIENQPYLIHAQMRSQEYVKMMYEKSVDGTLISSSYNGDSIIEDSFLNLIGTDGNKKKGVLVLEIWVKPGCIPMFPEGAFFTIIGDKIVSGQMGLPYSHGKFPFGKIDHIYGGKFYSSSIIEDLIPLQKEYNRTRGQIIEAKNRMAKPQWIAPIGSINPSQITTEPGQVITYKVGYDKPSQVDLKPLPSYAIEEINRILLDWNDISGQHEVTQGQTPPGVTAATAISYLQERDESVLSPTFDSLEECIEKVARLSLSYVHDYWTYPRLVKVTGPNGSFDALAFKGSDLGSNLDISVEAGSSLPVSKAAKQALIMDLMKMGFIDPQRGLEVMDMGGINKIYEQLQIDQRQVQRENLRMSKVTPELLEQFNAQNQQLMLENPSHFDGLTPPLIIPTNSWDDHKLHFKYHNDYRKSQSFEASSPEVKALFEAHVNEHVVAIGLEDDTMNPRKAAGLPSINLDEGDTSGSTESDRI